jgi:hypothetical protein
MPEAVEGHENQQSPHGHEEPVLLPKVYLLSVYIRLTDYSEARLVRELKEHARFAG